MDIKMQQQLLDIVKNNYDEIAADFSQTREKKNWPIVAELASAVPKNASVLDVGCGNGRLLDVLPQNIGYIGVDNSEGLIEIARKRYPEKSFLIGDLLDLSVLGDKRFDRIFCIAAIHHLPGNELRIRALKEMAQHLEPGGQIILTAWNLWANRKFRPMIIKAIWEKFIGKNKLDLGDLLFDWKDKNGQAVSRRYYHAFTMGGLKKIIRDSGLEIKEASKDKYNYYLILK